MEARRHFADIGLNVNFFQGVHGRTWGLRTVKESNPGYIIPSGHVGLNLSYWALWQMLSFMPENEFLILEDDAYFDRTFIADFERAYNVLPANWQFCYVGHLGVSGAQTLPVTDRLVRLRHGYPHGTHATLVNKTAIPWLLETQQRAEKHIDQQLATYSLPGLHTYAFEPSLARQHSYESAQKNQPMWTTIAGSAD